VSGFLIEFNRRTSARRVREFDGEFGPQEALRARIQREVDRDDPDLEIVSINADSLDTVRRTHSRYFEGAELAAV
jgi:hypothetical protein